MKKGERILFILFVFALCFVIWINFFENLYIKTNLFTNTDKLNRIVETLSMSYITSYIFYFVIYFCKYKQEQKIILPFIADSVIILMNNCLWFCNSIRNRSSLKDILFETSVYNRSTKIYLTKNDLDICCKEIYLFKIDENNKLFSELMVNHINKTNVYIKQILDKSNFIDVELLSLLTRILTSNFHQDIYSYYRGMNLSRKYEKETLMCCKDSLEIYFNLYVELEKYSKKHLNKYVENKYLKIK